MVPFTIWLIVSGKFHLAFAAFIIAGISDGVDGFIAKRFNQTTRLGAYLDPLADKLLLVSIYLALGFLGTIPPLLVIIVVAALWLTDLLWTAGQFKTLTPHFAGVCRPVTGVIGAEDITIHPHTGTAFISAYDRRAADRGKDGNGAIFAYSLSSPSPC